MACILLWSSAVRIHDSQAYRKMDVTWERISHILEPREILLSIQTGFSLVNATVVCAIVESSSDLEPSSVITEPRHSKLAEDNTEQIESTSGVDHRCRTGRLQSWKEHHRVDLQPTNPLQ